MRTDIGKDKDLALLFWALKKDNYGGGPFKSFYSKRGVKTCFINFKNCLEKWTVNKTLTIDISFYMKAQLDVYKENTHPPHLLSLFAYKIYQNALRNREGKETIEISLQYKREIRQLFFPLLKQSPLIFCRSHRQFRLDEGF